MLFFSILGICCAFIAPIIFAMIARYMGSFGWKVIAAVSLVPFAAVLVWVPINYEWNPTITVFGWYGLLSWLTPAATITIM